MKGKTIRETHESRNRTESYGGWYKIELPQPAFCDRILYNLEYTILPSEHNVVQSK